MSDPVLNESDQVSLSSFVTYAQPIMDVFAINQYSSQITLMEVPAQNPTNNVKFLSLKLQLPANIWGQQALKNRKDELLNDFEVKVLDALARRCRFKLQTISSTVENNIDLSYLLKIEDDYDVRFNQLLNNVYTISKSRNNIDSPIITNIKRGQNPLPPRVE